MSSYPALLNPLMEPTTGLIATTALNDTAQLALGYALADREDVIVLNETTLRLKGDPAKYTGDASTDLLIDGEIHSNTVISSDQGYYTQQGTNSATVNIKTFDNTGYHNLTSNATGLYLNTNLEVGTLKYSALDPPIAPSATPSLSEVIAVSGDAGNQDITNIKDLTAHQLKTAEKIYLGDNVVLSTNVLNGNQLVCDAPFTVQNVQATIGMSIYNTTDYLALFEADTPTNKIICYTDGSMTGFGEFESKIITSTGTSGTVLKNNDSSFTVDYLGNTKVKELTYESLSPAIPTSSLSDVLISGNSAGLNNINMNTQNITNVSSITSTATGDITTSTLNTKVLNNTRSFGIDCNTQLDMKGNRIILGGNFSSGNVSYFENNSSGSSTLYLDAGGLQLRKNSYFQLLNNSSDNILYANPANNSLISQTNATLEGFESINAIVPQFKPQQEYWVSPSGSDTSGVGSLLSPFQTIQKAINTIELFNDGLPKVVNILSGVYNETLTISKSRISFLGHNVGESRADTSCSINGLITINCTTDLNDLNNNNIVFNSLMLNSGIVNNSSSKNRVSILNSYVYGNSQLLFFNNSNDYRVFINNCTISNESTISTDSMVLFSGSGMVSCTNTLMTCKSLGSVCEFNGSSRIDTFAQNILTNMSSSSDVQAILKLTSPTAKAVGLCSFIYSNSAPKSTASPNYSCGILMNTPSNSYTVLSLWNNVFSLNGTTGTNADFAVNQTNSNNSVILFGNNASVSNTYAHNIIGNLNSTKVPFVAVQ